MSLTVHKAFGAPRSRGGFTLRECVVGGFILSVLLVGQTQVAQRSREQADRIKCAMNLRQIGQAVHIYANANGGAFPRTAFDETANPIPTEYTGAAAPNPFGPGGPGPNDVTAPLFLLLRTTGIVSDPFVCPTVTARWDVSPWRGDPSLASNFPSRANLSYAYANPYASQAALAAGFVFDNTLPPGFALAADMGPGGSWERAAERAPRDNGDRQQPEPRRRRPERAFRRRAR